MAPEEQRTGILRSDIRVLRGESLLLFDPAADTYYKVSERIVNIIAYFSEDLTVGDMVERLRENGIDTNCSEICEISNFLRANALLTPRYGEAVLHRKQLETAKKKSLLLRISSSYLFFRLPPWRPENFFRKITPAVSWLVSKPAMLLWSIPAVWGYLLALRSWGRVTEQFADTLSWAGLVKYALAVIVVKLIHEAAHSLAAMGFNCRVRGVGIGFIFFVPRLYTDTTDSWKIPRRQRLLIDGAGIIAEVITGGFAALLWHMALPGGMWHSTMFYIFTTSVLSTLLVNGNVFIRYDGYYILSDLLGVENLMNRSFECVKKTWRWYLLRLGTPSPEKRKLLLISYGSAAFIYRIFLYTSICLLIYYKFIRAAAIVLLVLELYALVIAPLMRELKTIRRLTGRSAGKAAWILLSFVCAASAAVLFVPISWGMELPGEIVPVRQRSVTVTESGYLLHPLPEQAVRVNAGTVIAKIDSPQLDLAVAKVRRTIDYDRLLLKQQELDEKEFANSVVTARKIHSDRLALEELRRRKKKLTLQASHEGFFVPASPGLSAGALLKRNTVIGKTVSAAVKVCAYAGEDQAGRIYPGQMGSIRFADDLAEFPCRVVRIDPVAVKFKESPVLQFFGGPVAAYQTEKNEFSPVQTLYCIELELRNSPEKSTGRMVKVKLDHSEQLYRHIKRMAVSFFRKEF